jgi:LacI family transcriptional regulator
MKTTMSEIASLAGVSISTVSKILNGNDQHISDKTRTRVMELVTQYNYSPNFIAKSLKTNKTKTIGFIQPDICNPFFAEIAKGIDDEAKRKGYLVLYCNTNDENAEEVDSFRALAGKMVDGIIFTRNYSQTKLSRSTIGGIPVVLADRYINTEAIVGRVYSNAADGICKITRYLLDKGCAKLAFIAGSPHLSDGRYEGFVQAHQERHVDIHPDLISKGTYDIDSGYRMMQDCLERKLDFDGVVCGNDLIALGATKALAERRVAVPRDVKVTGCDDIFIAEYTYPPLTTVHQPIYKIGRECARMLISHIENGTALFTKEMPYELVIRESA